MRESKSVRLLRLQSGFGASPTCPRLDHADRHKWETAAATLTDAGEKAFELSSISPLPTGCDAIFRGVCMPMSRRSFPASDFAPIDAHRGWVRSCLTELMTSAGAKRPDQTAGKLQTASTTAHWPAPNSTNPCSPSASAATWLASFIGRALRLIQISAI